MKFFDEEEGSGDGKIMASHPPEGSALLPGSSTEASAFPIFEHHLFFSSMFSCPEPLAI